MRLFVTCNGNRQQEVSNLVNILDTAGHEACVDQWLLGMPEASTEIAHAIHTADVFIYALTNESAVCERCLTELQEAARNPQTIPIVVAKFDNDIAVPNDLKPYPVVKFHAGATPQAIVELLSLLRDIAAIHATRTDGDTSSASRASSPISIAINRLTTGAFISLLFVGLAGAMSALGVRFTTETLLVPFTDMGIQFAVVVIFLLTLLLGTKFPKHGILLHIILQAFLLVGYFAREDSRFVVLLVGFGLSVGVLQVSQTQILMWPWLSYQIKQHHRRLKEQIANRTATIASAKPLIKYLNKPIVVAPYGMNDAMLTLASAGISAPVFSRDTVNPIRREQYRAITQQVSLQTLMKTTDLAEMLRVIENYELIPDNRVSGRIMQHKIQNSTAPHETLRVYAQFLQQLDTARLSITQNQPLNWQQQAQTYRSISDRLYQLIDLNDIADYWVTYDALDAAVRNIETAVSKGHDRKDMPRHKIQNALQQLEPVLELVRSLESQTISLSQREREWHTLLQNVRIDARQLLSTDYQERQELLSYEIERLQIIAYSQPASWLAIDRSASQIAEHHNPWCVLNYLLLTYLQYIRELDVQYVEWAEEEVGRILEKARGLKGIADLDQQLVDLTISGDSFGPMIDGTIQMLHEISSATQVALNWPAATHYHRQSMIEAQDKANQLRSRLRTRYVSPRSRQWADVVQHIIETLDDYQQAQQVAETTTYKNPYIVGNPIPAKSTALFKGRRELAEKLVTNLRSDNYPTLVLHGPRRMGKTSFLLHLQNLLRGWSNYIPIFLSGQEAGLRQNDATFCYMLARTIHRQIGQRTGHQIERPNLESYQAAPFLTIGTWLQDEIYSLLNDDEILLVSIDEFEKIGASIRAGEISEKVLDFLRYTMQHSEKMLFLFCGVQTLEALGPNAASYFISVQAIEIGYLTESEATELICSPVPEMNEVPRYSREVIKEIYRLTYGQPYLIQAICSKIIDIANERHLQRINKPTLQEALPTLFTNNRMYFQNIWDDAGTSGRRLLAKLAHGPAELSREETSSPAFKGLLDRCVVHYRQEDEMYEIEIPLVEEWVAQQI